MFSKKIGKLLGKKKINIFSFIKLKIKIDFFIYRFLNDIKRCQEQAQTQALILEASEAVLFLNHISLNKFVWRFWQENSQKLKNFVARFLRTIYLPIEMFMENMFPFGEKILRKDEMFFKKDEFVNAAESISGKMGLIKYWDTISEQTKNSIWEYIQGLYILGMASLGYQTELQELIIRTGFKA